MKLVSKKQKYVLIAMVCAGVMNRCPLETNVAYAEKNREFLLDQIVVTALREEKKDIDIPAMTHVFDKERIQELGAENVLAVLENVEGFTITASPTGNTYIGFRGMAKDNVTILVNGIPMNQQGNYDLETISMAAVERIEVVKGGSSVLYGTEASAGVVNIITSKRMANMVSVGAGNDGKRSGTLALQAGKLGVAYSHDQMKDMGRIYDSAKGYYKGDRKEKDSLNLEWTPDEHWDMQYMYNKKESDYTLYNLNTNLPGAMNTSELTYKFGQVNYRNDDLRVSAYARERMWDTGTMENSGNNYGVDAQNKWIFEKFRLTAGIGFDKEKAESETSGKKYERNRDSGAVYFLTETPTSQSTTLYLGAREAYIEDTGNEFCPQLQVLHKLDEKQSVYFNVNKTFRAPTVVEQYGISATQLANPDLKPESGWTYEVGWKKQMDDRSLKFGAYHMKIEDRLYNKRLPNGTMYDNAPGYKNIGLEATYEEKVSDRWKYSLSVNYGNPEQQANVGANWKDVDYRLGFNATLGYRLDRLSANLLAGYLCQRADDIDPMLNVNMNMRYKTSDKDSVIFAVNNLLNRDDWRSSGGSLLQERNWSLTYRSEF